MRLFVFNLIFRRSNRFIQTYCINIHPFINSGFFSMIQTSNQSTNGSEMVGIGKGFCQIIGIMDEEKHPMAYHISPGRYFAMIWSVFEGFVIKTCFLYLSPNYKNRFYKFLCESCRLMISSTFSYATFLRHKCARFYQTCSAD